MTPVSDKDESTSGWPTIHALPGHMQLIRLCERILHGVG